jgi:4'-phosphopantetheinyl transferase superfamily protein
MSTCRIGLDVTSVAAWHARLRRTPEVGSTAFSAAEREWGGAMTRRYAVLWALKEALVKAHGTGFASIGWLGVEVDVPRRCVLLPDGPPAWWVTLAGSAGHVVAVVTDVPASLAVGLHRVETPIHYRTRSALARATADGALRMLTATRVPANWNRTGNAQPILRVGARHFPVSLSHGDGLIGAAVAVRKPAGPPEPPVLITAVATKTLDVERWTGVFTHDESTRPH